jgi:hypothetical protein
VSDCESVEGVAIAPAARTRPAAIEVIIVFIWILSFSVRT